VKATQENTHPAAPPPHGSLDRALALVEFLRAHCPWDAAQTPQTLVRHLVEETYEVVNAIAAGDDAALRDELGDLLLNLAFQVVLGEERGGLDRAGVVEQLEDKMRRRHPHLYGLGEAEAWESIKARERQARRERSGGTDQPPGLLDELPADADPLLRAHRMQEIVARVGFDWPDATGAWDKVREEVEEVRHELDAGDAEALESEIGDLLFSVVNLARRAGVFAPGALSRTNAKFVRRFAQVERLARDQGARVEEMDLQALDVLWDEVKRREREGRGGSGEPSR
jgi:nucleoside triphosphate diphosphatase